MQLMIKGVVLMQFTHQPTEFSTYILSDGGRQPNCDPFSVLLSGLGTNAHAPGTIFKTPGLGL